MASFGKSLEERIRVAYNWAVYPLQDDPRSAYDLDSLKVSDTGGDSMAQRVGSQLKNNDQLIDTYGSVELGSDIHNYLSSAFENGVLPVKKVWETITRFPYMPRLTDREVLDNAIEAAPNYAMDPQERFALASGRDEGTGRFHNLIIPGVTKNNQPVRVTDSTLFVDWDVAVAAYVKEIEDVPSPMVPPVTLPVDPIVPKPSEINPEPHEPIVVTKKRYFATARLDPDYLNRELVQINEKILDQLRMAHADITISLEIRADNPGSFDDSTIKLIEDNAKTLKLDNSSFEEE